MFQALSFTAWADQKTAHFRNDLYGRDPAADGVSEDETASAKASETIAP